MKLKSLAIFSLALGLLASCTQTKKHNLPLNQELKVTAIYENGESVVFPKGFSPNMIFDSVKVAGLGDANRFFGGYTFNKKDGSLKFDKLGLTMMMSPNQDMEYKLMKLIDSVRFVTIEKDNIIRFLDAKNNKLIDLK